MIWLIFSSFEITNIVTPDPKAFLWIAVSVADAAAVNPDGIKTLLANDLVFSNCTKSLPKNPPDFPISCNWVFDNFVLADEPFVKALQSPETYVLVNNSFCGKVFSSLESLTTFNKSFKV